MISLDLEVAEMRRDAQTVRTYPLSLSLHGMSRKRVTVSVSVMDGDREVDRFVASSAQALRDALKPIFRHIDAPRHRVVFHGTEDRWLPGGIMRSSHHAALPNLSAAIAYLS